MTDITIIIKHTNGAQETWHFDTPMHAYRFCHNKYVIFSQTKILFIKHNNVCVFSSLGKTEPLSWKELQDYFYATEYYTHDNDMYCMPFSDSEDDTQNN